MTNKDTIKVEALCRRALNEIDNAIQKHERGEDADLSIPMLQKIRVEIEKMLVSLNPREYMPSYARFMLDSWEDKYGLVDFLAKASYQYKKLKPM
ncbi:hypothetical protein ABT56_14400 [Photobacterium aquae]|uniref:Uncharacterized protein n=1 Tax=Photobacterium aquae TaxID=1195763 RepID=A0A0J1GYA0_9GAMM|nr:hypothetical protein [Photobacterium aquae]KLV04645.1 hypothetical protein ABT56_14400 [Photobacterium aquae]